MFGREAQIGIIMFVITVLAIASQSAPKGNIARRQARTQNYLEQRSEVDRKWEEKADKDNDCTISKQEYRKAQVHRYLNKRSGVDKKWEEKVDTDKDGTVSGQELKDHHQKQIQNKTDSES